MADKINTPKFRAAYINIFKARAQKQDDGSLGKAKYSIRACFPPDTDFTELNRQVDLVVSEKFGDKPPKVWRKPFRLNEELENPVACIGDDWVIMTFSANEDRKPGIVDANLQDILDEQDVYSGAWYRVQVRGFWYENKGNKGVSFGLENVQKLRDDEPLGGGKTPANKAFDAVQVEGGAKNASSIFG